MSENADGVAAFAAFHHLIPVDEELRDSMRAAPVAARAGRGVTLAARPSEPSADYRYIASIKF